MHASRELAEHEPILTEYLARRRDRRRQIYLRLIIAGSLSTIVTMITACGNMTATSDRTIPAATTTSTSDSSTDVSRQTDAAVMSPTVTGVGSAVVGHGTTDAVPELLGLGSLPQDGAQCDLSVPEQGQVVVAEPGSSTPGGEVLVASQYTGGQAGSPVNGVPHEVATRLPPGLATILSQVNVVWGCHPVAGCHYGVWDESTSTVWLADWLLSEPSLLFDVVSHELAHAADSLRLDAEQRSVVYALLEGPARTDELLADCVALAAGATWTHYWDCPSLELRETVYAALGLN